jgi:hypothetical protein
MYAIEVKNPAVPPLDTILNVLELRHVMMMMGRVTIIDR